MATTAKKYNYAKPDLKVGRKCSGCHVVRTDTQRVTEPMLYGVYGEIKTVPLCSDCYDVALNDI